MNNIFQLSKSNEKSNSRDINIFRNKFSSKRIFNNEYIVDDKFYAELMQEYKVYLYKIAYSYVKNEQSALDIIQETTYKGLINISKLKNVEYFKTWITQILINTSIDHIRKNKNVVLSTELLSNRTLSNYIDTSIEDRLDLYIAIDNLNYNHKTVIILKYFNDMTEKEISKIMEIPVNTVKSHIRRAKVELKNILNLK